MSFVWSKTFWMNFPVKSRYDCSHNNLIIVEIKCCGAPTTWWDKWTSGMYVQMLLMCWGWVGWIPEAALSEPTQHNTLLSPQWSSQHWLYSTRLYLLVILSFIFLIDAVSRDKIFMIQLSVQQSHWSTLSDVTFHSVFSDRNGSSGLITPRGITESEKSAQGPTRHQTLHQPTGLTRWTV